MFSHLVQKSLTHLYPNFQVSYWSLWVKFSHKFHRAFIDTALEQRAYGKLANFTIGTRTIDEYVAHFEHLL